MEAPTKELKYSVNTNYQLHLEVLTPVHVGASKEKEWVRGLDYFYFHKEGKVYVIDQHKLLAKLGSQEIDTYAQKIASGNAQAIEDYLLNTRKFKPSDISRLIFDKKQDPESEIKTLTRTGNGNPYIPGSSLKGALRSVLFTMLYNDPTIGSPQAQRNENNLFGSITANLMRLVRLTDVEFERSELLSTKIFNLFGNIQNNPQSGWKHGRNVTSADFRQSGFVVTYEVFPKGSLGSIRLGFAEKLLSKMEDEDKRHLGERDYQSSKPKYAEKVVRLSLTDLFKAINKHTSTLLDREILFFKKYSNSETPTIIEELERLKGEIPLDNSSCVMRLGAGSGFHSITGDWRFSNHTSTIDRPDSLNKDKKFPDGKHYKSRKFAFEPQSGLSFYPMGFVKLHSQESWSKAEEEIKTRERIRLEKQAKKQEEEKAQKAMEEAEKLQQEEEARIKKEEELKPKPFTGKLKQGVGPIDAIVVLSAKPNKVKIEIQDSGQTIVREMVVEMTGYSSPLKLGDIVLVRINALKGNAITQVGFVNFKK